jgi:hypothetical protein
VGSRRPDGADAKFECRDDTPSNMSGSS